MSRIRPGFEVHVVADCPVVIATGDAVREFAGMIRLNETSLEIWRALEDGLSNEQIAERLCLLFEVAEREALASVERVVDELSRAGALR
ncbi:MAG: PqqD family protein [Coriobacteriaceae bacterium]|nr:PqqD family protein [Coriobacteriaceae bacterium]